MTKRCLLVLALAASVATGAFAQSPWSIGGGAIFEGGSLASGERRITVPGPPGSGGFPVMVEERLRQTGFGAWVFVDATFVELSVAFMGGSQTLICATRGQVRDESVMVLDATLLGKLPILFGWGDIFPLLGVGGQLNFGDLIEDDVHFRIVLGAGGDIFLTRNIFARASILGSYRFGFWDRWGSGGFGVAIKAGIGFRL